MEKREGPAGGSNEMYVLLQMKKNRFSAAEKNIIEWLNDPKN